MSEIIGRTVIAVRPMTKAEIKAEGWDSGSTVIVLNDGTKLYASRDSEGNDAGTIFGSKGTKKFAYYNVR